MLTEMEVLWMQRILLKKKLKIVLPSMKQKLNTCKKFSLIECWVDKRNASWTEIEAWLIQVILAILCWIGENNAFTTEIEAGYVVLGNCPEGYCHIEPIYTQVCAEELDWDKSGCLCNGVMA